MTLSEAAKLLAFAATFDQRTIGDADVAAWHVALGRADYTDSRDAVVIHYRSRRDRIMPADVLAGVRAIIADRESRRRLEGPQRGTPMPEHIRAELDRVFKRIDMRSAHPDVNTETRKLALSVGCPYCGVGVGKGCVSTVNRYPIPVPHPSRVADAGEAARTSGYVSDDLAAALVSAGWTPPGSVGVPQK